MQWQDRTVLVTGAGGFIGSHLVEELVDEGAIVRAFVRYNSRSDIGLLQFLPPTKREQIQIIAGDLRDSHAVQLAAEDVSCIFHLGALIAIPYSYRHPREVIETNVMGTLNILMAARASHADRLVHTSTSEVYGTALMVPMNEDHPLQGQSPYSASKIGADKIAESFHCAYGLPVVTIRPFNTYGPRQSARAVIPTIITQALTRDRILLGDTRPCRDFTFVGDTVRGFLQGAESERAIGEVVNLGSNEEISIGDLAQRIVALVNRDVSIEIDEQRIRPARSEVKRLRADNAKARALLGWSPHVTLDAGLARTVVWVSQNLHLYDPDKYRI
jgi:NAD dependent epimerase/dehydratase